MPPEQALGHSVDKRGICMPWQSQFGNYLLDVNEFVKQQWLSELLGQLKRSQSHCVAIAEVSLDFEKLLQSCMQPSAAARPYDVTALRQELEKKLIE